MDGGRSSASRNRSPGQDGCERGPDAGDERARGGGEEEMVAGSDDDEHHERRVERPERADEQVSTVLEQRGEMQRALPRDEPVRVGVGLRAVRDDEVTRELVEPRTG